MAEWTQEQRKAAVKQVMDDVGTMGYANLAHEYCCQWTLALATLKRIEVFTAEILKAEPNDTEVKGSINQWCNSAIAACTEGK